MDSILCSLQDSSFRPSMIVNNVVFSEVGLLDSFYTSFGK